MHPYKSIVTELGDLLVSQILENFMRLILQNGFWLVHLPIGSIVKFQFLAHLSRSPLRPIMSSHRLPGAMDDRDGWWETVRQIRVSRAKGWRWLLLLLLETLGTKFWRAIYFTIRTWNWFIKLERTYLVTYNFGNGVSHGDECIWLRTLQRLCRRVWLHIARLEVRIFRFLGDRINVVFLSLLLASGLRPLLI